jgi:EF-hand domain
MLGKDLTTNSVSEVLQIFYSGTLKERMEFIFDMYDTNRDGSISKDDVRLLLSHVPCEKSKKKSSSHIMVDSQTAILGLIADCFKSKELLSLADFTSIVLENCSDMFIAVMILHRFSNI